MESNWDRIQSLGDYVNGAIVIVFRRRGNKSPNSARKQDLITLK